MKPKPAKVPEPVPLNEQPAFPTEDIFKMILPPGTELTDFFIPAHVLLEQLDISKRKLNNMRRDGKVSHTSIESRIVYLKQELAAILAANIVIGKKSILRGPVTGDVKKNLPGR